MELAGNHLGNQTSVTTQSVINNKINPVLALHRLAYHWENILSGSSMPSTSLSEGKAFTQDSSSLIRGGHEAYDHLLAGVGEYLIDLGKLFSQRRRIVVSTPYLIIESLIPIYLFCQHRFALDQFPVDLIPQARFLRRIECSTLRWFRARSQQPQRMH